MASLMSGNGNEFSSMNLRWLSGNGAAHAEQVSAAPKFFPGVAELHA